MKIEQRIAQLVEEKIQGTNLFCVDIRLLPKNRVLILIDGDKGVTIAECAAISKHVGFLLEEENAIEHAYTLEVSSPGVDTPLVNIRQYPQHTGRTLAFKLLSGSEKEGVLKEVRGTEMIIDEEIKEKGKKVSIVETQIPFEQIKESKVLVTFK